MVEYSIVLPEPHEKQKVFLDCGKKRVVIRAGRRSGKTTGIAIMAVEKFLEGRRILYATPTADQITRFWHEVTAALADPIARSLYYKNETEHVIELRGTEQRIRAKTAYNADTLRGDYADLLILDEWQLMDEDAWGVVGAPMLLDNNGDAVFIYTPPSLHSRSVSKARDKGHAAKLFKRARADTTGRWAAFHFTSHDNPHLSREALAEITQDMTRLAYEQEIMAEDKDDAPGALWKRSELEAHRAINPPDLIRIVVAIDPAASSKRTSDENGIIVAGLGADGHGYTLDDRSLQGTPLEWAREAIAAYHTRRADRIIGEQNNGGEMVETTIRTVDANVSYVSVYASRGKAIRAEPIAALYEQGKIHHVGTFAELEDQLCQWVPGDDSPDRLDALVWAYTELMLHNYEGPLAI